MTIQYMRRYQCDKYPNYSKKRYFRSGGKSPSSIRSYCGVCGTTHTLTKRYPSEDEKRSLYKGDGILIPRKKIT